MIITIYLLLLLFVSKCFLKKYGFFYNANFLITLLWVVFGIISVINPLKLRPTSLNVQFYSLSFLFFFNLFSYWYKSPKQNAFSIQHMIRVTTINKKLLFISVVSILLVFPLLSRALLAIISGNYELIRSDFFHSAITQNYILNFFLKEVPISCLKALLIVYLYFYFRNQTLIYLLGALICAIIPTIITSGRGDIVQFIFLYIIMHIYFVKNFKLKVKVSKWPIIISVLGVLVVTFVVRKFKEGLIESIILYFSGSFHYLDYILVNESSYGLKDCQYGLQTFAFLTEPIVLIMKVMGLTVEKTPNTILNSYIQNFVDIGGVNYVSMYNNNATTIYPFLLDFGYVGIIIGAFFLATLLMISYKKLVRGSLFYTLVFLYVLSGLLYTTMAFSAFYSTTPIISLFVFIYISSGENKINKVV